jgi:hypothetical protein
MSNESDSYLIRDRNQQMLREVSRCDSKSSSRRTAGRAVRVGSGRPSRASGSGASPPNVRPETSLLRSFMLD